ncbi:PaaI family thioesterase [Streptomyces jumonjinensis]|uniref:PaaI family thioesterase n=1 Tax=Streptomyces jumonjinensis TaxID=1945 RepID=A0A646KGR0_STRJU|nr:PaaI family thioesterase [Streptomyces jumonjinensis]MQT01459.1 PaaI family thioesterase [Streptomyces jumonjinensis]
MTRPQPTPDELPGLMPLAKELGIVIDTATRQEVTGRLEWSPERCTAGGVLHGGALVTFADSAAGICAYLNLPPGAMTSTIELKTNFFAAVRGGEVLAVARPLHVGRTVIVVQTDLFAAPSAGDAARRRVGQTTQTQAVIG